MKCPTCQEEGERSRVEIRGGTRHLVHISSYYDEDGKLHVGHPGGTNSYACSRGHTWTESVKSGHVIVDG